MKSKVVLGILLTPLLGVSVRLLSMSVPATEQVSSEQTRTMEIGIQSSSETVTHRMYAVKDADDRPTGNDVELRIGREGENVSI